MRRPVQTLMRVGLALASYSVLFAQVPDLNFLNNDLANEISRLEALLGDGPKDVTGKLGPTPNGGECTLQITVADKNDPSRYYTHTVNFITPDLCKNYRLEKEQDGFIKVVPKNDSAGLSPADLASLQALFKFLGSGLGGPQAGKVESSSAQAAPSNSSSRTAQRDDQTNAPAQTNPEVLQLPLAPPLSAGRNVTSPDGCQPGQTYPLFQVNHYDNSVTRFDGCPMQITATIPVVADGPLQAALTPDNSTLIVTSYNQGITFIDTATNKVTQTLMTDGSIFPAGIAMRKDGTVAYIASLIDQSPIVAILDVANRKIVGKIPLPLAYPQSVYFSPDGLTALVTFPLTNLVSVIDVLTSTVSTGIPIATPHDIAFNPTGTRAYITSGTFPSGVEVVDTATYRIIDSYPVDGNPGYVLISPDGRFLTVMDYDSPKIWIIELATRKNVTIVTNSGGGGLVNLH
jgi:hypothetical protein